MAFLAVIAGGSFYMANDNADDGLNIYDLPAAINKLIAQFT